MKTRLFILACAVSLVALAPPAFAGPKSRLDNMQFDGVSSDGELKTEGHTRRQWLQQNPVQAKEYWKAWDCKGKPCDSQWNANIRKKAAQITRTDKDPPDASVPAKSQ